MEVSWTLTAHEENVILPLVAKILDHRDKKKVFSNNEIRNTLLELGEEKIHDSQIRKIVWHIRQRGLTTLLIANSDGYYKATNIEEVKTWIATHKGKIEKMLQTLEAIECQFKEQKSKLATNDSELTGQVSIFEYIDDYE
jgi:hypothetical protein